MWRAASSDRLGGGGHPYGRRRLGGQSELGPGLRSLRCPYACSHPERCIVPRWLRASASRQLGGVESERSPWLAEVRAGVQTVDGEVLRYSRRDVDVDGDELADWQGLGCRQCTLVGVPVLGPEAGAGACGEAIWIRVVVVASGMTWFLFLQTATLLAPDAFGLGHASRPVARSGARVGLWPLGLAGKELQTPRTRSCLPARNFGCALISSACRQATSIDGYSFLLAGKESGAPQATASLQRPIQRA
jgi:hypothetical protein